MVFASLIMYNKEREKQLGVHISISMQFRDYIKNSERNVVDEMFAGIIRQKHECLIDSLTLIKCGHFYVQFTPTKQSEKNY